MRFHYNEGKSDDNYKPHLNANAITYYVRLYVYVVCTDASRTCKTHQFLIYYDGCNMTVNHKNISHLAEKFNNV